MAWFEVFIPGKTAATPAITLTLEAQNWIGALRSGLANLGEGQEAISNVMCDIKEDNSIHVTDVSTNRIFRLREVQKPNVSAPPTASTRGPRTLLEFQRPRFDEPLPAPPSPPTQPSMPPATSMPPTSVPPTSVPPTSMPPPPVDDADTVRQFAAPGRSVLDEPTSQSTVEMSIPWATMPAPSLVPRSPAVAPPGAAEFPPAPHTPLAPPTSLPSRGDAKPYDLSLPQARVESKAEPTPAEPLAPPVVSAPAPKGYDITLANPKAASAPPTVPTSPSPPPSALAPATAPVPDATERVRKATLSEPTERVARAPSVRSASDPTPRGTPAPPPKRASGQFENAPKPTSREVSDAQHTSLRPADIPSAELVADAIADVFDATHDLIELEGLTPERIAGALLDIALAHIPAEGGTFYLADLNGHELSFAAVRGPLAATIQKANLKVPIGHGVVGICALEGICLRVSDVGADPRHDANLAGLIGYTPRDMLAASAEFEGRCYGAIQLIDAKSGFSAVHMEVLRYIGSTAAQLLERQFMSAR